VKALENQIRQICSLYFEGWKPELTKQPFSVGLLDFLGEILAIASGFSLFSFLLEGNFLRVILGILFLITSFFVRFLGKNLQKRNQAKSPSDRKEDLIGERFNEAAIHLTIIEKQNPLKEDEEALIITLANLSVLTPTTRRDEMVFSLLEEATRTRLIELSLFKALCQKFQVNLKPL